MKNTLFFIGILFISSCSRDLNISHSEYNRIIPFDQNTIEDQLGPYSTYFVSNKADASIAIEFHDIVNETGALTIGAYLWDKYSTSVLDSGNLKIGNLNFTLRNESDHYTFVPEGVPTLLFDGSDNWVEYLEEPDEFLSSKNTIALTLNDKSIISVEKRIPSDLGIAVSGTPNESFNNYLVNKRDNVQLNWNANEENENGLLLMMRFTGQTTKNIFESPVESKFRFIVLEDDGSETLPIELFNSLPVNSMIEFEIWRGDVGNYKTSDNGTININIVSKGNFSIILEN